MRRIPRIVGRSIFCITFCVAISLILICFGTAAAQQTKESSSSIYAASDNYPQLLDRLLPRETPNFRQVERQIIVRVCPSFTAEWQFTIRNFRDGHSEATYFEPEHLAKSNLYYFLTYFEMDKGSPASQDDLETLARGVHVRTRTISKAPPAIEAAVRQFLNLGIPTRQETGGVVDGTMYEVWAQTGIDELHVRLWGKVPNHVEKERPLVKWIMNVTNLLKAAVEKPAK